MRRGHAARYSSIAENASVETNDLRLCSSPTPLFRIQIIQYQGGSSESPFCFEIKNLRLIRPSFRSSRSLNLRLTLAQGSAFADINFHRDLKLMRCAGRNRSAIRTVALRGRVRWPRLRPH